MSAQSLVISLGKRPRGLSEHRGGYDSSHSWQGPEDLDIAVLALLAIIALYCREFIQQGIQARAAALALSVDQAKPRQQQGNMLSCGFDDAGCDPQRGSTQRDKDILRVQFRRRMQCWRSSRSMVFRCTRPPTAGEGACSSKAHSHGSSAEGHSLSA
jgi:hypothetical protein